MIARVAIARRAPPSQVTRRDAIALPASAAALTAKGTTTPRTRLVPPPGAAIAIPPQTAATALAAHVHHSAVRLAPGRLPMRGIMNGGGRPDVRYKSPCFPRCLPRQTCLACIPSRWTRTQAKKNRNDARRTAHEAGTPTFGSRPGSPPEPRSVRSGRCST